MIDALSRPLTTGAAAAQSLLAGTAFRRDDESRLAASLRTTPATEEAPADAGDNRLVAAGVVRIDPALRRIAHEIVSRVEARLPGRISQLEVRIENDQFVLCGVASSYYVKQVAQHLAMNALDARMLGRLVNEIEVRPTR